MAHDIEDPVICCACHVLPATCRVHTVVKQVWRGSLLLGKLVQQPLIGVKQDGSKTTYWCQICYERHEDHGPHHVCDLDSSDSPSEEDVGAAPYEEEVESRYEEEVESQFQEDAEHHCEDVAVSESSWQIEDAMSESSWHTQDDCSSTKSFNLTWHQVDDGAMSDTSSQCSFMMVTPGSLAAEYLHKHQQCDAAADAAATEDAVSTSNNLGAWQEQHELNLTIAQSSLHDQEHAPALQEHAPAEQEHQQRGQMHTILALHDGCESKKVPRWPLSDFQAQPLQGLLGASAARQESQPTSSSSSSPAAAAFSVGKWQEQQELDIALALPLEQQEKSQLPSSSSSSSSSSNSAAFLLLTIGSSSSSSSSNSAAATAAVPAAVLAAAQQKKTKGFKNKKVPRWPLSDFQTQPLQPIQEQPILAIPYHTPSGCLETMFINQEDDDAVAHRPCIKHGLDHHPHCRDCVNYQFMLAKSQHAMAEQTALELSLGNSKIVGPVGPYMQCSKHGEDFKEDCPTCMKICDLNDQWAS